MTIEALVNGQPSGLGRRGAETAGGCKIRFMNEPNMDRFPSPAYVEPRDFEREQEAALLAAERAADEQWIRDSLKKERNQPNERNIQGTV